MAADSDYEKVAEHALAMLKVVYLREGPDAAVSSAKYMVEAAAIVIANGLPRRNAAISALRGGEARTRTLTVLANEITEYDCAVARHAGHSLYPLDIH